MPAHDEPVDRALGRRRTRAAAASVVVAVALVIVKATAGVLTNSLSLLASSVDSLTDIFASAVNFFAIRAAARPADREHAYGHDKAEGLAGLFQGVVIGGSGVYLGYESILRLRHPQPLEDEAIGILVMAISMVASFLLARFLRKTGRETSSLALVADSTHYATDVLANGGVLLLLVIVRPTGLVILDPIVSFLISAYIVFAAFKVVRDSADQLMDRSLDDAAHDEIRRIALSHPEVHGVHDVRSRCAGAKSFIELHLEIDGRKTLEESHAASVAVLRAVEAAIAGSKVFVHTDPVRVEVPEIEHESARP